MTAYSKTFVNAMRILGGAYSPKWQQYNWNAFNWGFSTNVQKAIVQVEADSITPTTARIHNVFHLYLAGEHFSFNEAIAIGPAKFIAYSSFAATSAMTTENLQDGSGYTYVYPSLVQNAHNRSIPVYTSSTAGFTSFTSSTHSSTAWVET